MAKKKTVEPTEAEGLALDALAEAFTTELPPFAEGGFYQPTSRDRWATESIALADGEHEAAGWRFTIAGGLLAWALRLEESEEAQETSPAA